MGLSPADLLQASPDRPQMPTFAEYLSVVSAAVSEGTRRVYSSYWNRILDHWGQRQLDEPTPSDIQHHAAHRHAPPDGQLLRYTNGKPITTRRYDHLWSRIGTHLPWVATQQISTHWLRHTTLTWVERHFGYAIARAYAGHTDNGNDASTTTTYIRGGIQEIAAALTGEPHPLA